MAGGKGIDDPEHLNAFLAMIGCAPVPEDHSERLVPIIQSQPAVDQDQVATSKSQPSSGENTATPASPTPGTRAPPTTPATAATAPEKIINLHLDPIKEHEIPEIFAKLSDPNSSLQDSKYARAQRRLYNNLPLQFATMPTPARPLETGSFNKLDHRGGEPRRTTVQQEILEKIAQRSSPALASSTDDDNDDITSSKNTAPSSFKFEDEVLAKFKARAEAKDRYKGNVKIADKTTEAFPTFEECCGEFPTNITPKTPNSETNNGSIFITATKDSLSPDAIEFIPSSHNAVQSPPKQNTEAAVAVWPHLQNTEATPSVKSPQAVLDSAKAELIAKTSRLSISVKEPGSPEEVPNVIITSSEDPAERENATHFTSWGTPQARTTRARVRKVILRGLPVSADLTLVQSLIHGGAIDSFALGVNGTAAVTFTSPDACDAYYAKYPNGLTVKYNGKNYVVYVEKGTDINVISGMLQGQLECGASRCVRAVGADHDLGMAALIKLAEGKTRKGKVEHIDDAWRNEIRTIVFRFTSISDAVIFKAMLMRDDDWEACNIQFMDDPCERASGIHLN